MTLTPHEIFDWSAGGYGWFGPAEIEAEIADSYGDVVDAVQALQDQLAAARPTAEASHAIARLLHEATTLSARYEVSQKEQLAGHLYRRPGRAQPMVPPHRLESFDGTTLIATVTFGRAYLGGNDVVFGGAIPLIFDELFAWLAQSGRPRVRTAYLHVNYRDVTPIDHPLTLKARVDKVEGRKLYLIGSLEDGSRRVVDVEGLWVVTRPDAS
jgi:hypothetical protein